jgi:hypothetical protein
LGCGVPSFPVSHFSEKKKSTQPTEPTTSTTRSKSKAPLAATSNQSATTTLGSLGSAKEPKEALTYHHINATMGKGGCQVARETLVSALDNEREEKIKNQPKFYWAHDEEPHRRR